MGILQFFTDGLGKLTDSLVPLGLAVFALVLGFFSILYLNRRRNLLHQERMASLIKGLHYAGVAKDVFAKPKADARDHLLSGLRWLFGGIGMSGAVYGYQRLQPAADASSALAGLLAGLIPALLGLAHLIFSWLTRRKPGTTAGSQAGYRVANRRY
jgi:hypothetical protein